MIWNMSYTRNQSVSCETSKRKRVPGLNRKSRQDEDYNSVWSEFNTHRPQRLSIRLWSHHVSRHVPVSALTELISGWNTARLKSRLNTSRKSMMSPATRRPAGRETGAWKHKKTSELGMHDNIGTDNLSADSEKCIFISVSAIIADKYQLLTPRQIAFNLSMHWRTT